MSLYNKLFFIPVILVLFVSKESYSQNTKTTQGTATIKIEANQNRFEARNKALRLAMINGIENVFGTYVEQESDLTIKDGKTSFNLIGSTKVKGEWIESFDETFSETSRTVNENGETVIEIYITCEIKGKVRELIPKADIEFEILNCPQLECRTRIFHNNEQLYLYFMSPVDGYLSVFVNEGEVIRRILPYNSMPIKYQNGIKIESDEAYLIFSPHHNKFENSEVDEILLYTKKPQEQNTIILVFSEREFIKPILDAAEDQGEFILPKSLSLTKFSKWLVQNRAYDYSFQDVKINIEIKEIE